MRHFRSLDPAQVRALFVREPQEFERDDTIDALALGIGATIYCPAIRDDLADDVKWCSAWGATSVALCLEDAVAMDDLPRAEASLISGLQEVHRRTESQPLIFVRVRRAEQIPDLVSRLGPAAEVVCGFILPKFTPLSGPSFLDALADVIASSSLPFLAMPVLESAEIIERESRAAALVDLADLLTKAREQVLALRFGATDLCGLYGIRRPPTMTIYDVKVVADLIADVVNVFRRSQTGFRVTGPAWEYYDRVGTVSGALDGLAREVALDRLNGLTGKTVVHPSHLPLVHGHSVISWEDYEDACSLLECGEAMGGAFPSVERTRMNEASPHRRWALEIVGRAEIFGVARPGVRPEDIVRAATP